MITRFLFIIGSVAARTLVIGITGSGKSSIVNSLVGSEVAAVSDFSTGTFEIICYKSLLGEICDTMGFFDGLSGSASAEKRFSNADILDSIAKQIPSISSLILVVDPTGESRQGFMAQQINMLIAAQKAFGRDIWTQRAAIVVSKSDTFNEPAHIFDYIEKMIASLTRVHDMVVPAEIIPVQYNISTRNLSLLKKREEYLKTLRDFISLHSTEPELPVKICFSADLAGVLGIEAAVLNRLTQTQEDAKTSNAQLRNRLEAAQTELSQSSGELDKQMEAERSMMSTFANEKTEIEKDAAENFRKSESLREANVNAMHRQRDLLESGQAELRHNMEMRKMYDAQAREANRKSRKSGIGAVLGAAVGFVVTGTPQGASVGAKVGQFAGGI